MLISLERRVSVVMEKQWIIPDVILVGYGRTQTIQFECLNCERHYFPDFENYSPVCDICEKSNWMDIVDEWRLQGSQGALNIVGWEQKTSAIGNKGRSRYNYVKTYIRDKYTCQYCGYTVMIGDCLPLHIDHVIPFVYGGGNRMNNLVVACADCNLMVHSKIFKNFLYKKDFIHMERYRKGLPIYNAKMNPFPELYNDAEEYLTIGNVSEKGLKYDTGVSQDFRKNLP